MHHITVLCKDAGRSVDFYRNLLGMRALKTSTNPDDPAEVIRDLETLRLDESGAVDLEQFEY